MGDNAHLAGEDAALIFAGEQYLFRWHDHAGIHARYIAPGAVRAAFANEPIDTGWLSPHVVRWGMSIYGEWAVMGDIEAEASPKINPKIHDLNFVMLA